MLSILLAIVIILSLNVLAFADNKAVKATYIPLWMEPYTVVTYDSSLNRTIVQGGELTEDAIAERDDVKDIGMFEYTPDLIILPNTKVEYDLHGFIQNIYFKSPIGSGNYQLSDPNLTRNGTGYLSDGQSYSYGSYTNFDTHQTQQNTLRNTSGYIYGTGRITYYTGTTGESGNTLTHYDCATKMYYCDVAHGKYIYARNTYTGSSYVTFRKMDCSGLPKAILDIWSNASYNPIVELTTTCSVDNVYADARFHFNYDNGTFINAYYNSKDAATTEFHTGKSEIPSYVAIMTLDKGNPVINSTSFMFDCMMNYRMVAQLSDSKILVELLEFSDGEFIPSFRTIDFSSEPAIVTDIPSPFAQGIQLKDCFTLDEGKTFYCLGYFPLDGALYSGIFFYDTADEIISPIFYDTEDGHVVNFTYVK